MRRRDKILPLSSRNVYAHKYSVSISPRTNIVFTTEECSLWWECVTSHRPAHALFQETAASKNETDMNNDRQRFMPLSVFFFFCQIA